MFSDSALISFADSIGSSVSYRFVQIFFEHEHFHPKLSLDFENQRNPVRVAHEFAYTVHDMPFGEHAQRTLPKTAMKWTRFVYYSNKFIQ